jgi:acetyl esterase/lipase
MADPEVDAVRAALTARPRPNGLDERRQRLDALGAQYALPADMGVKPVNANTSLPNGPPRQATRVIMFLHGGGYISGSIASHRHMIAQAEREAQARTSRDAAG